MPLTLDDVLARVRPFTVVSTDRLTALAAHVQDLRARHIPGDLVECGTARGGSAAVLGWALGDDDRRLHLYDRFVGLPPPTAADGPDAPKYTGANQSSEETVRAALALVGFPPHRVTIHAGDFADTLPRWQPKQIALLHVDADWYESVLAVLRAFYDLVRPGGIIVLDDFGFWPGCRHAFYEFCHERRIHPTLDRVGEAAWWEKSL